MHKNVIRLPLITECETNIFHDDTKCESYIQIVHRSGGRKIVISEKLPRGFYHASEYSKKCMMRPIVRRMQLRLLKDLNEHREKQTSLG